MVEYQNPRLDSVFASLGHPVRRSILEQLRLGTLRVTELAAPFDLSLAAVSKHIGVLEDARLLHRTIVGREHRIALAASELLPARQWLETYREFWEAGLDRLEASLGVRQV